MTTVQIESTPAEGRRMFLEVLAGMTESERVRAYRGGAFTRTERTLWAANFPEEVPLVNDEFEWIALGLADLD